MQRPDGVRLGCGTLHTALQELACKLGESFVNADPNDKRTDRVYGEVGMLGMFIPGWGMHLADIAIAQGDLIREVGEISARSRTGAPR